MNHLKPKIAYAIPFLPVVTSGQSYPSGGSLSNINNANDLIGRLASLGDVAVYLLIALAVLYIVYSTVRYFIMGKEGDEARREAGMNIFYGLIGLFIIVSIWGLVALLTNTFPTSQNQVPPIPSANFVNPPH